MPSATTARAPSSSSSSSSPAPTLSSSLATLTDSYKRTTERKTKLVDCFLLFLVLQGIVQFAYCVVVTSFPYNAFLGGFASSAGQFVLLAGLRFQISPLALSPASSSESSPAVVASSKAAAAKDRPITQERAFADFCFASVVLHWFCFHFLG